MKRWHPLGAHSSFTVPTPGSLLAWDHAVWRVIEVNDVPEDLWAEADHERRKMYGARWRPQVIVIRPARITGDDPRARDRDQHLRTRTPFHDWFVYPDEHYPVCVRCAEPLPCREQAATRQSAQELERMARYEVAGVCPACKEPVTARQKSHTFGDNLVVPLGPPVTFHLRNQCIGAAAGYDRKYVAADPDRRAPTLYCDGTLTLHGAGSRECSNPTCPGGAAEHRSMGWCRCRCAKDSAGTILWACPMQAVGE